MLPEEGIHEKDCDCGECRLKECGSKLTEFELFCLNWYYENVGYFTVQANMLSELVRELELKGMRRRLFFWAMDMIYATESYIGVEKQRKEIDKAK